MSRKRWWIVIVLFLATSFFFSGVLAFMEVARHGAPHIAIYTFSLDVVIAMFIYAAETTL